MMVAGAAVEARLSSAKRTDGVVTGADDLTLAYISSSCSCSRYCYDYIFIIALIRVVASVSIPAS